MQRRPALLAAALLIAILAAPAGAETVTVTVPYEVAGGLSPDSWPLNYTVSGGLSLDGWPLAYPVSGYFANLSWTVEVVYEPYAELWYYFSPATGYGSLGGFSLESSGLVYGVQPSVLLGNATFPLRIHVRVVKDGEVSPPDFDVEYSANGTKRVAVRGEDALEVFYKWVELLLRDPLILEFPETVRGCTLLNSTRIEVDPRLTSDVYVYYLWGPPPQQPPPRQPPPPEEGEQPGAPVSESPIERAVERAVSEAYWRLLRFLSFVAEALARWIREQPYIPLLLLLLLAALLIYLVYRRRRRGFVLVIEVG